MPQDSVYHYRQDDDPGAVGEGRYWIDTSVEPNPIKRRNDGDTDWIEVAASVSGGAGGGTEYVEDAVPPGNPTGPTTMLRRRDTLASEVSAEGDWIAANATAKGELYVKQTDAVPVTDNGGSLTVDGTFWQATQPVSGPLTDAQLRAVAVPVSGTFYPGTQPVSGEIALDAATLAALESIAVVDGGGSLTVDGPLTDTQLRATAVPVSGTVAVTGAGTQYAEDSPHANADLGTMVLGVRKDTRASNVGTDGDYAPFQVNASGDVRVDASAVAVPVTDNGGSLTVDGTVSISGTIPTSGGLTDAELRATPVPVADGGGSLTVDGTFWQATQPVSGTVTANAGTGPWPVTDNGGNLSIDDGGNSITVDGTVAATQSGAWNVTNVSGTVSLPTGASTLAEQQTQTTSLQLIDDIVRSEDEASGDGHKGAVVLGVRKATPANTSGTDGDYEALQLSAGRLWASATIDAALPAGTNAIGKLAANDGVDVGDVTINNASGASAVNVQDGGNSITVDQATGTNLHTVVDSGTITTVSTVTAVTGITNALPAGTNAIGKLAANDGVDIGDVTVNNASGASAVNVQDGGNSLTVDQATAANLNAQVVGTAATDAAVSGNPLLDGGRASTAIPTAMSADGDAVPLWLDRSGALIIRPRPVASYAASYRLAVAASALSLTFTPVANTDKQLATIYHASSAAKTVRVRRIAIYLSVNALGVYGFEVRRLSGATAPATGNPAITPVQYDSSDGAAEATCLALPGTQGTETGVNLPLTPHLEFNSGAVTAETNPGGLNAREMILFDARMNGELKPLLIRAGVAEGLALIGRGTTTAAIKWTALIEFTEE